MSEGTKQREVMESSSAEGVDNFTFDELLESNECDIAGRMPFKLVLSLCCKTMEDQEAKGVDVFHLWVQKLLKVYTYTLEDLQNLIQCFKNCLQQILSEEGDLSNVNTDLDVWFANSFSLLAWLQDLQSEPLSLVEFLLDAIGELLGYRKKIEKTSLLEMDLEKLLQDSLNLLNAVLQVFHDKARVLIVRSSGGDLACVRILRFICNLEEARVIDLKTTFEMYKWVAKLTISLSTLPIDKTTDWARKPCQVILQHIHSNIRSLYQKSALQLPEANTERCLRVTKFYLKLLLKISSSLSHETFPVGEQYFHTYGFFKCMPSFIMYTKFGDNLQKYLSEDMRDVLGFIYKNSHFNRLIYENDIDTGFVLDYLEAIVRQPDVGFIHTHSAVLLECFQKVLKDPKFIHNPSYGRLIVLFATFALLDSSGTLKKTLIQNVLQADIHIANISCEILLVLAQFMHKHKLTEAIAKEMAMWRKCNDAFALHSSNPVQYFVERLLANHCRLCVIYKTNVWDQQSDWRLVPQNYRFLLVMGPLAPSKKRQHLLEQLLAQLNETTDRLDTTLFTPTDYYNIVFYMKLLAKMEVKLPAELQGKIVSLLQKIMAECNNAKPLARLVDACFELCLLFNTEPIQNIMSSIKTNMIQLESVLSSVAAIKFLEAVTKLNDRNCRDMAASVLKWLETNHIHNKTIRQLLEPGKYNESKQRSENVNLKIYDHLDLTMSKSHKCEDMVKSSDENHSKRPCLESQMGELNVKDLLGTTRENAQRLETVSHECGLDEQDLLNINNIVKSLNAILKQYDNNNI